MVKPYNYFIILFFPQKKIKNCYQNYCQLLSWNMGENENPHFYFGRILCCKPTFLFWKNFFVVCSSMRSHRITDKPIKLIVFSFTLVEYAKNRLYYLSLVSITI